MVARRLTAADDGAEVIKGTRLVMLLDLLDAGGWQDRLRQGLPGDLPIEVRQVALVPHHRHERRLDLLLEQLRHVEIREEGMHQDLIHVLVLTQSVAAVLT